MLRGVLPARRHCTSLRAACIATGNSASLEYFISRAFSHFELDWKRHVCTDPALLRPSDIRFGAADPALAKQVLGWQARTQIDGVIAGMCEAAAALHESKT